MQGDALRMPGEQTTLSDLIRKVERKVRMNKKVPRHQRKVDSTAAENDEPSMEASGTVPRRRLFDSDMHDQHASTEQRSTRSRTAHGGSQSSSSEDSWGGLNSNSNFDASGEDVAPIGSRRRLPEASSGVSRCTCTN